MKVIDKETGEGFNLDDRNEAFMQERATFHADQCEHTETEIRECTVAGGSTHYREQCLRCGELRGSAIKKSRAPDNVRPKDERLQELYSAERKRDYESLIQRHVQKQKAERSHWLARHDEYLKSPAWRAKREKVLKRANGICEGCGERPATEVHHKTYEHHMEEFLFELVALCGDCHDRIHMEALPEDSIWLDRYPCGGCRWQDEEDDRRMCGMFGIWAKDALAEGGPCGPDHAALEPLK